MKLTAFAALLLSLVTMSFAETPAPIHVALIFDDGPVAESATRLLALRTLLNAILYTQGQSGAAGEFCELERFASNCAPCPNQAESSR